MTSVLYPEHPPQLQCVGVRCGDSERMDEHMHCEPWEEPALCKSLANTSHTVPRTPKSNVMSRKEAKLIILWPEPMQTWRTALCSWFSTGVSKSANRASQEVCTGQPRKLLMSFSPQSFLCALCLVLSFPSSFNSSLRWEAQTYVCDASK